MKRPLRTIVCPKCRWQFVTIVNDKGEADDQYCDQCGALVPIKAVSSVDTHSQLTAKDILQDIARRVEAGDYMLIELVSTKSDANVYFHVHMSLKEIKGATPEAEFGKRGSK